MEEEEEQAEEDEEEEEGMLEVPEDGVASNRSYFMY